MSPALGYQTNFRSSTMTTIHKVSLALLAGAMTAAFAASQAEAGMRHPGSGQHHQGWQHQGWQHHGWQRQAWHHNRGWQHQAWWWKNRHGWDRRYAGNSGWGDIGDASDVTVVSGSAYGGAPVSEDQPILSRDPSFGGYVYRSGRGADGSVFANYYRSYQPYAPPVIIRIP